MLAVRRSIVFATSNPAATYQLDDTTAAAGTFVSRPFDAGGPARWGAIRWAIAAGAEGAPVEIYTRTGNSRDPDGTWSAWGPAMTDPSRSRIVNPDGRYLQWRARFVVTRPDANRLSSIRVHYEPINRPPRVKQFGLSGGGPWVADSAGLSWAVLDPDEDSLETTLEYRAIGVEPWTSVEVPGPADVEGSSSGPAWNDRRFDWDVEAITEGEYEVRLIASDRGENTVAEGRTFVVSPPLRLIIDRTPPRFELRPAGQGRYELTLEDVHSEVRSLQVLAAGKVLNSFRPVDGVCDSLRESFSIELPDQKEQHLLRGTDAAGNHVEIPIEP